MCSCQDCGSLECRKTQLETCIVYSDCRLHSNGFDLVNDDLPPIEESDN